MCAPLCVTDRVFSFARVFPHSFHTRTDFICSTLARACTRTHTLRYTYRHSDLHGREHTRTRTRRQAFRHAHIHTHTLTQSRTPSYQPAPIKLHSRTFSYTQSAASVFPALYGAWNFSCVSYYLWIYVQYPTSGALSKDPASPYANLFDEPPRSALASTAPAFSIDDNL